MARINVFLKDDLLKVVDSEAELAGTNRSALIQAALAAYLETQQKAREEAESQRPMDDACKRMDAIAEKLGSWDPVSIIREFRDTRSGGVRRSRRSAGAARRS